MNMGKKDLDSWGRDKAKSRYADGGGVSKEVMDHAKDRLGQALRNKPVPSNREVDNPSWRNPGPRRQTPGLPQESKPGAFGRDEHLIRQGLAEIKTGGRIKK